MRMFRKNGSVRRRMKEDKGIFGAWIMENIIKPRFIVNDLGEFGVRLFGVNLFYYKDDSPLLYTYKGQIPKWRYINRKEFSEVIHPWNYYDEKNKWVF